MLMTEVREIARQHDLKTARMSKTNIIRLIQRTEGNNDCFATLEVKHCGQAGCLWRSDCKLSNKN